MNLFIKTGHKSLNSKKSQIIKEYFISSFHAMDDLLCV